MDSDSGAVMVPIQSSCLVCGLEKRGELRRRRHRVRGAAVGVPESRNMSGIMSVWSIPIVMAIGGFKTDFWPSLPKPSVCKKNQ